MISESLNILLADDDADDCLFFKDALEELSLPTHLSIVHDGEQLMQRLNSIVVPPDFVPLPDILFLDLNMPRKNGMECLAEIKNNKNLKSIPVIIVSTSFEQDIVNQLFKNKAHYYIRKPSEFSHLKNLILQALELTMHHSARQPEKERFILSCNMAYSSLPS